MKTMQKWMLTPLLAGYLITAGAAHGLTVDRLRCEQLVDPLGIDAALPRLSWVLESDQRGMVQSAYQILVASAPANLDAHQGDLWDSGKVASDRSIQVPYAGTELASGQRCFWKVRVWDGDGRASDWSPMARWSMGLLDPEDWQGQWIGLDEEDEVEEVEQEAAPMDEAQWIWHPQDGPSPADTAPPGNVWFRRALALPADRPIDEARIWLTADNAFILFVNGEQLGRATNFSVLYGYDLDDVLRPGENIIAIECDNLGDSDNPAGLIVAARVTFQDGDSLTLYSDGEWKTTRDVTPGWEQADYDDSAWRPALAFGAFGIGPWGKMEEEAGDFRRLRARYLRREFAVGPELIRATAYMSGLGLSELYLNGVRVGDQVLSPGLTEYTRRVFYVTHDVTDHLRGGENAIGVLLGNGRYYAPRLIVPTRTLTYGYPKLLFQLELEYADGSQERVVSDLDWKLTTDGPLGANNEYDGEEYDARREMPGWAEPGFDDGAWQAVAATTDPGGALRAEMTPPIRVTDVIRPIAMTEPKPGVFIFDMGQNMVGWCGMKVRGPRGTVVRQRHAEVLQDDGTLYLDNIRSARVTNTYTLKGGGWEYYEPRFTYHGFRFVEVTGYPGRPDLSSSITGMVVHDDLAPAGDFECSHPLLNQIYSNIRWGTRGNYRSFPTDCPQRDERQAWLGDRSAFCKGESYMFDIGPLYAKWNRDMLDSQTELGEISDVCPPYWPFYSNNVTWPSTFVIVPGMLYDQYGDIRTMASVYDGMKRWVDFMSGYLDDYIIDRDQYGDWCVPPESPELIHSRDPARRTAGELLATAYFYHVTRCLARYGKILDHPDDAERYNALADNILQAFNNTFFDPDANQYDNGTQTAHILPLSFGMVPKGRREAVFEHLVGNIVEQSNSHIGTGLIGAQWLMRTLSDNGRTDLAFDIATQTTYPSWGYMIEQGATTMWELWNGDTADPAMNSRNHVMLVGDLGIWMTEYLGGIQRDPSAPAFKRIVLEPHLVGTLDHVRAHYDSIHGRIESHWQVDGQGRFQWQVRVPANTQATVSIPTTHRESVHEGDQPANQALGVTFLRETDGRVVYQIGSGLYHFSAQVD